MSKKIQNAEDTESTVKIVEVSSEVTQTAEKKADFCVYIGPTILGVIQNGTIYSGDKSIAKGIVASAIEKYPHIADFLVNDYEVAAKKKETKTKGNHLYMLYKNFLKK